MRASKHVCRKALVVGDFDFDPSGGVFVAVPEIAKCSVHVYETSKESTVTTVRR